MRYLGGKSKIGKKIAEVILKQTSARGSYYEPFLGGGEAFRHLAPNFTETHAGDIHESLILMWQSAAKGWIPPSITESEYAQLRSTEASPLQGFAEFGCSFGGKSWGGFARGEDRNYADESSRNVQKIALTMKFADIRRCSYSEWKPEAGSVVYADPPYEGTTGYKFGFDHVAFWAKMEEWSRSGAFVFVSEYDAPDRWTEIWSGEHKQFVSKSARKPTIEKLFVFSL